MMKRSLRCSIWNGEAKGGMKMRYPTELKTETDTVTFKREDWKKLVSEVSELESDLETKRDTIEMNFSHIAKQQKTIEMLRAELKYCHAPDDLEATPLLKVGSVIIDKYQLTLESEDKDGKHVYQYLSSRRDSSDPIEFAWLKEVFEAILRDKEDWVNDLKNMRRRKEEGEE